MRKWCIAIILILVLLSLQCQSQDTTITPLDTTTMTESSSSATSQLSSTTFATESSNAPTTVSSASSNVTTGYTCRTPLNTSPNLSPFWVTTVLSFVPTTVNVSSCTWRDQMETRLLALLAEARAQSSSSSRRKRAAESGQLALQMVSTARGSSPAKVSLVHYALLSGSYLPAGSIVASLTTVSSTAASVLGYAIESLAVTYEEQPDSMNLWLIGAMFGSLAGIVLITWAVLCIYQCCLKPHSAQADKQSLGASTVDDFYADGAMANIPDVRANPRLGFSKADIGTIADEVAKHLDTHMTELVQPSRMQAEAGPRPSQSDAAAVEAVQTLADRSEQLAEDRRTGDKTDGEHSPMGSPRRRSNRCHEDEKSGEDAGRQLGWTSESRDDAQIDVEEVDEIFASVSVAAVEQQRPQAESEDQNSTAPSRLPSDFLLMSDLESTAAISRSQANAPSPYRTGDQIAKIRPLLEADLELTQESPPLPPAVAAEVTTNATMVGSGSSSSNGSGCGGSRLISVRPRDVGRHPGQSASRPVTASANQDEWDVVRELARRPDSDTRALLGTVQREVTQFASEPSGPLPEADAASSRAGRETSTA